VDRLKLFLRENHHCDVAISFLEPITKRTAGTGTRPTVGLQMTACVACIILHNYLTPVVRQRETFH